VVRKAECWFNMHSGPLPKRCIFVRHTCLIVATSEPQPKCGQSLSDRKVQFGADNFLISISRGATTTSLQARELQFVLAQPNLGFGPSLLSAAAYGQRVLTDLALDDSAHARITLAWKPCCRE
jgi:hypothetical protein